MKARMRHCGNIAPLFSGILSELGGLRSEIDMKAHATFRNLAGSR